MKKPPVPKSVESFSASFGQRMGRPFRNWERNVTVPVRSTNPAGDSLKLE